MSVQALEPADASAVAERHGNPMRGIVFKLIATALFSGMVVTLRWLGDRIPLGEVVFARAFIGAIPVVVLMLWTGTLRKAVRTRNPMGHLTRSVIGVTAMFLSFASYQGLPMADAVAIGYTMPFFVIILAATLLGERVQLFRWIAVAIGFLGVVVSQGPHFLANGFGGDSLMASGAMFAAACGLLGAVATAGASVTVSVLTRTENPNTVVFYFTLFSAFAALFTLPFGWVVPSVTDLGVMLVCGILGGLGQIFMTMAYRHADASTVAPFEYSSIGWTVLAGILVFDELPTPLGIAGVMIIIGAGLFVVGRERKGGPRAIAGAPSLAKS